MEGKVYLSLANHFPTGKYGQQAYDALEKSTQGQPMNIGYRGQALIRKADAARAMNELGLFTDTLEQVLPFKNWYRGALVSLANSAKLHLATIK